MSATVAQWYKEHLGIDLVPGDYSQTPWSQEAGPTVFAPFPHDTDYFGRIDQQWMVNFRVRDLEAMVEQLRGARIEVAMDLEAYGMGFAASGTWTDFSLLQGHLWEQGRQV